MNCSTYADSFCSRCPADQYSLLGSAVCTQCSTSGCQIGFYRQSCSAESDSMCIPCTIKPTEAFFVSSAGYNQDSCSWKCPAGMYRQFSACIGCSAGTFSTVVGAEYVSCEQCNAGKYSSADRSSACVSCSAGKFSSTVGLSSSEANDGSFCSSCQPGKYSTNLGADSSIVYSTHVTQDRTRHRAFPAVQLRLTCDQICTGSESLHVKYGTKEKKINGIMISASAVDQGCLCGPETPIRAWEGSGVAEISAIQGVAPPAAGLPRMLQTCQGSKL